MKPNDGLCHLDRNSPATYTHSTEQDYPSVSQVLLESVLTGRSKLYSFHLNKKSGCGIL